MQRKAFVRGDVKGCLTKQPVFLLNGQDIWQASYWPLSKELHGHSKRLKKRRQNTHNQTSQSNTFHCTADFQFCWLTKQVYLFLKFNLIKQVVGRTVILPLTYKVSECFYNQAIDKNNLIGKLAHLIIETDDEDREKAAPQIAFFPAKNHFQIFNVWQCANK